MFASAARVAMSREDAPAGYFANGVIFNNNRLRTPSGVDLDGNSDGKLFSGSFWFKRITLGGTQNIWHSNSDRVRVRFNTSNVLEVMTNGSPPTILHFQSSVITDTSSWHHFMFSLDLTDTGKRHAYLDGVTEGSWPVYANTNIDFTRSGHAVGSDQAVSGFNDYKGDLADFWLAFNQYIDLSVAVNRLKFRSAAGKPAFLGDTGENPTTTSPLVFFSGDATIWNAGTNKGSAQDFNMTGSVTDSPTSPSD